MQFTYDAKERILRSLHPDVYVKFSGNVGRRWMWVLFYHGKRIGFFVFHERLDGERWREDKSDYRVVNWILTAGESWPGVPSYKFQTFEEQDEIMQIIKFALACYYGVGEAPRHGVEARFHDILKSRIAKGFNIAKQL